MEINFYKHHLGDYASHTSHLTWDEDCAYRRLIDQYYKREAPLPKDLKASYRLVRANSSVQKKAVDQILKEFFILADDGWHQKRCDAEIAAATAQAASNKLVAADREKRRRERMHHESLDESLDESSTSTSVGREPSQTPDSRLQTPDSIKTKISTLRVSPNSSELGLEGFEKTRVENSNGKLPTCPFEAIAEAYHQELPELPSIVVLSPGRKRTLQARWREVCASDHLDRETGLTFFRDFFKRIRQSQFLLGKVPPKRPGDRTFKADFDWILNPANFLKIVEGRYHHGRQQF